MMNTTKGKWEESEGKWIEMEEDGKKWRESRL